MKYTTYLLSALLLVTLSSTDVDSKRVNVRPAADDGEQDDAQQAIADGEVQQQQFKPVLVARRPLQHRPQVDVETERQPVVVVRQSPRVLQQRPREQPEVADDEDAEQPQVIIRQPTKAGLRAQPPQAQQLVQQRLKQQEQPPQQKEPTAQTIRNFNKLNDDGSFTFGYEADDGSFKEETRGTDCVVRGKYGYVDPDGNKREFTYVQGNPCDPNATTAEDEEEQPGKPGEEENVPANIPVNAGRPKPKNSRPTTTLFQQTFGDFESQPQPQPSATPRQPSRQQLEQPAFQETPRRPPPQISPVQLQADRPSSTAAPPQFLPAAGNLESAIRNLPQPALTSGKIQSPAGPNSPLYTTELVFDPATGQYNTVIFQQVPKQQAGININQRLPLQGADPARQQQPLPVQQFRPQAPPQFQQPQPQFRPAVPSFQPQFQSQRPIEFDFQRPAAGFAAAPGPQQQLVQQQQAMAFQQSQNLFRQQQQKQQLQQQQQQSFQPQSSQFFPPPSQRFEPASQFASKQPQRFEQQPEAHQQQFVLVQPGRTPGQQSLAAGQIDAFLRGHNVQF
ncbi:putative mediator of RNA polymerase II transcription subunit 26 [Melanaphis sacchari]|uniref:putative mediator of RNA polymerase II transcription subunit 26 n=1 Tax=Melanaphis sacchari TaxID=742174 RepID=UPI000DC159C0|nr:putative mediator of RNA polymerase II transcription subunit 26 [Melanaphis sacchari]